MQITEISMLIQPDFCPHPSLPPRLFLEQIMDPLCKAYCFLWDHKSAENKVNMTWKDLSKVYNKTSIKTALRKLNNEGLLNYEESNEGVSIELVSWDDIDAAL